MRRILLWFLLPAILALPAVAAAEGENAADAPAPARMSLADFARRVRITKVAISPDGRYLGKLIPEGESSTRLDVVELATLKTTAAYHMGQDEFILDFHWANSQQVVWTTARPIGPLDLPYSTGTLWIGRADKSYAGLLGRSESFVSRLPNNPNYILVSGAGRLNLENLENAGEKPVVDIPYKNSSVLIDRDGKARMLTGRDGAEVVTAAWDEETRSWKELRRSRGSAGSIAPLSYSADLQHYYTESNVEASTTGIYLNGTAAADSKLLFRDSRVDVDVALTTPGSEDIGGVLYDPDYPTYRFFDEDGPLARTYGELRKHFPNCAVLIGSSSDDGRLSVVSVWSDVRPTEYYLFDRDLHDFRLVSRSRPWIDREQMSPMTAISLKARDGVELQGYLTLPRDGGKSRLPLVVLPHGGPHGPRDFWGFDQEVQLLAYHGYAVLQVNFRGSGGYGRDFEQLGYGHWGTSMQDDLTDATRWAVQQGIADAGRICISGGSYGGYAALMGVIREPDLYRCAVSFAGPYDLSLQRRQSDTADTERGRDYFNEVLGTDQEDLKARSPAYNVGRIKVPLLLVHGKADRRVPISNLRALTAALDKAGKPYETLVKDYEGHGFYSEANSVEFYARLLDFLDRNIGEKRPAATAPAVPPATPAAN